MELKLVASTELRLAAAEDSEILAELSAGEIFRMLESKLGWAWGYASNGCVGYVRAETLAS